MEQIPALVRAGVACFKIEGRLKGPEYVALTTRIYRDAVDAAWTAMLAEDAAAPGGSAQPASGSGPSSQQLMDLQQVRPLLTHFVGRGRAHARFGVVRQDAWGGVRYTLHILRVGLHVMLGVARRYLRVARMASTAG